MISREKMAQRTNSLQWRVTLPPAKLSFIKKLGGRNLSNKVGAMGDSIDEDGDDELLYIKNALKTYSRCVEELLNTRDISGISIYEQSGFLDPRGKFNFEKYNEEECELFRDYLVNEYGIERSLIE